MKLRASFTSAVAGHADKFSLVADLVRQCDVHNVLDVGCRDCVLRRYLQPRAVGSLVYVGLDRRQNKKGSVEIISDLERGLPFRDEQFDCVVALDVVEHTDDIFSTIEELSRVAGSALIVGLPNISHWRFRLQFLWSGRITSKYDLIPMSDGGRHKWLTVLEQTDRFIEVFSDDHRYILNAFRLATTARKHRWLDTLFLRLGWERPFTWSTLYVMRRPSRLN